MFDENTNQLENEGNKENYNLNSTQGKGKHTFK